MKLVWGDCGVFFSRQERFEFIYYLYVKKFLKRLMKRGVYSYESRKYWVFMRPNLTLTKKSTNSRMGKGKGAFLRRSFRTRVHSPLIEFKGVNPFIIKGLVKFLIFKTRLSFFCFYKNVNFCNNMGKSHLSKILYRKHEFWQ